MWNIDGMWAWIVAAPIGFMLLIFVLDTLEATIVSPADRAAKIRKFLEEASAEEVEGHVARLLAPVVPGRRHVL
ncbi:MAG: hypothetical protein ACXVQY_06065 [Actinomycetota bacterium]